MCVCVCARARARICSQGKVFSNKPTRLGSLLPHFSTRRLKQTEFSKCFGTVNPSRQKSKSHL